MQLDSSSVLKPASTAYEWKVPRLKQEHRKPENSRSKWINQNTNCGKQNDQNESILSCVALTQSLLKNRDTMICQTLWCRGCDVKVKRVHYNEVFYFKEGFLAQLNYLPRIETRCAINQRNRLPTLNAVSR